MSFEADVLKLIREQVEKGHLVEFWKEGRRHYCNIFVPIEGGGMRGYVGKSITMVGAFELALQAEERDKL